MADINYFIRKQELAEKARTHTAYVANVYRNEINYSIQNTKFYDDHNVNPTEMIGENWNIPEVWDMDTSSAIEKLSNDIAGKNYYKPCTVVLNFASFKNPGGMFINGSSAQEECLCHDSTLYNVLTAFDGDFYEYNRKHLHRGMYENRALISPEIPFRRGLENYWVNVITCAAPNFSPGLRYGNVSKEENSKALDSRIKFMLDACGTYGADFLILGAWGCGVFKQDPYEVAELFKKHLLGSKYMFKKVIFAIPTGQSKFNENFFAFSKVFDMH